MFLKYGDFYLLFLVSRLAFLLFIYYNIFCIFIYQERAHVNKNKILVFVFILLMVCLLVACTSQTVSVSFYVDGSLYKTYKVEKGKYLDDVPDVPEKAGYKGVWSIEDFDEVNADTRVDALYSKNIYTVTFMVDGEVFDTVTSDKNKSISTIPDVPEKDGYIASWNISDEDFSSVRTDTVVEAVYTLRPVSVVFYKNEFLYTTAKVVVGAEVPSSTYYELGDEYFLTNDTTFRNGVVYYTRSRVKLTEISAKNGILQGSVPTPPVEEGVSVKWMQISSSARGEVLSTPDFNDIRSNMEVVAYPYVSLTLLDSVADRTYVKECGIGENVSDIASLVSEVNGYEFYAWYYDEDCMQKVQFPSAFTSNVNLYAKWINIATTEGVLISDGVVYGYEGTSSDVFIPSKYQYTDGDVTKSAYVTAIGEGAFKNSTITGISLPATLKSIGNDAFLGCTFLTALTFPDGNYIETIGKQAFRRCEKLASFNFSPKTAEIGEYAFAECSDLHAVKGLDNTSISVLSAYCFAKCGSLSYLLLPPSITEIGNGAFSDDILAEIEFSSPDTVTKIGNYAFFNCKKFSGFLSENLTEVGISPYGGCSVLSSATLLGSKKLYQLFSDEEPSDAASYYSVQNYYVPSSLITVLLLNPSVEGLGKAGEGVVGTGTLSDCYSVKDVSFAGKVVKIETNAFSLNNYTATEEECAVSLPEGLEEIDDRAFVLRKDIRSIALPSSLVKIGEESFSGLNKLSAVSLSGTNSLYSVGKDAFAGTKWLSSYSGLIALGRIVLGISEDYCRKANLTALTAKDFAGITTIAPYAFSNNGVLKSVTLGDSVHTIGKAAFKNCAVLETFAFNAYLVSDERKTGDCLLDGCSALKTLTVCEDIAFADLFTDEILPDSLVTIKIQYSEKKSVIEADKYSFDSVENLTISDGFTKISENAFRQMSALRTVTVGSTVTEIEKNAFESCPVLESVRIEGGLLTVGEGAFRSCSALTELVLPDCVQEIGNNAFYGSGLKEFTAPASLLTVGKEGFASSSNLGKVTLNEGLLSVGDNAFASCKLVSFTLPQTVSFGTEEEFVGKGCLSGNTFLTELTLGTPVRIATLLNENVPESLTKITIQTGEIPAYAFQNLPVSTVVLQEVTGIGNGAFDSCTNLRKIAIPASVERIGAEAFANCTSMTSCDFSMNGSCLQTLEKGIFKNCVKLGYAVFPNVVNETNWEEMFLNCRALTTTNLPQTVLNIGDYAYSGCEKLSSVAMHNNVESIGKYAFANCKNIEFDSVEFTRLQTVGVSAFENCEKVKNIRADSVQSVGENAYKGCLSIEEITICENDVSYYAAETAATVSTVNISETATTVSSICFEGCSGLTTVIVLSSVATFPVQEILDSVSSEVIVFVVKELYDGDNLSPSVKNAVYCKPSQADFTYEISDGYAVLTGIETSFAEPIVYLPDTITVGGIKYTVKAIGEKAFNNRTDFSQVIIPSTVTDIGSAAFANSSLKKIVFESGSKCESIGTFAFNNTAIEKISIPSTVKRIGDSTFSGCSVLSEVYFPSTSMLTYIGSNTFYGTKALHTITLTGAIAYIGSSAFADSGLTSFSFGEKAMLTELSDSIFENDALGALVLPETVKKMGVDALKGYNGTEISLPDALTEIGEGAFQNASRLTAVSFPSSLQSIGKKAFYNNTSLTAIRLPDSLTTVGAEAFAGCNAVTEITVGKKLTTVGNGAFQGTEKLTSVLFGAERMANLALDNGVFSDAGKEGTGISVVVSESVVSLPDNLFYPVTTGIGIPTVTEVIFDGTPVCNGIGKNVFRQSDITEVVLPASLLYVGEGAFVDCNKLTIYSQTARAGKQWEDGWENVTSAVEYRTQNRTSGDFVFVAYGENAYITDYAGNDAIVTLPDVLDGLTVIGTGIGLEGKDFLSVSLPASVKTVGSFYDCQNLVGITLAEGTKEIPEKAFFGCGELLYFVIPSSVERIGKDAFGGCASLATVYIDSITVSDGWEGDESGLLSVAETVYIEKNIGEVSYLPEQTYTLLDGVREGYLVYTSLYWRSTSKSAYAYLLNDWKPTDSIANPAQPTEGKTISKKYHLYVDGGAMTENVYNWKDLRDTISVITVGEGVTSIGKSAFADSKNLETVYFDATDCVDASQDKSYFAGSGTKGFELVLGEKVTHVPAYLCYNNKYLRDIQWENATILSIGVSAFENCYGLTSLLLPDSVERIEEYAFKGCTKLQNLVIGQGMETFGAGCFADIGIDEDGFYLNRITYNALAAENLSGNKGVFSTTMQYTSEYTGAEILFGNTVTNVPDYLFYGCKNVSSVTFPSDSSLAEIGKSAFYECVNIDDVSIPSPVQKIGEYAFYSCSSLQTVTFSLAGKLSFIGQKAFGMTAYYNKESNWKNDVLYLANRFLLEGRVDVSEDYVVSSDTDIIAEKAFESAIGLRYITIPASVDYINDNAFASCSLLHTVFVSSRSVMEGLSSESAEGSLCKYAHNVYYMSELYVGGKIGSYIDTKYRMVEKDTLLSSVRYVSFTNLYWACSEEENGVYAYMINVDHDVDEKTGKHNNGYRMEIKGTGAMQNFADFGKALWNEYAESVESLHIDDGVTALGNYAFSGCTALKTLNFHSENDFVSIGSFAFFGCSALTEMVIPKNVTYIGRGAFSGCTGLTSLLYKAVDCADFAENNAVFLHAGADKGMNVTVDYKVVHIPAYLFCPSSDEEGSPSLTQVVFNGGAGCACESIGAYAFAYCADMRNFSCEGTALKTIREKAFYDCAGLSSVRIPSGVEQIGDQAYGCCYGLTQIVYSAKKCADLTAEQVIFGEAGGESGITLTITDTVEKIPAYLFQDTHTITKVDFPSVDASGKSSGRLETIGTYAFAECTGMISLDLPDTLSEIAPSAFYRCIALESLVIPFVGRSSSTTSAQEKALFGSIFGQAQKTAEEEIIPLDGMYVAEQTISDILSYSYYIPMSLTSITVTKYTNIYNGALSGLSYARTTQSGGQNQVAYYGVTRIAVNRSSVTDVEDKETGKIITNGYYIGEYAFAASKALTTVTLNDIVSTIGKKAFYGCEKLTSVTVPVNVSTIGEEAYYGCTNVENIYFEAVSCDNFAVGSSVFGKVGNNKGGVSVTIGKSVESIPANLFNATESPSVGSVICDNTVLTSIGDNAFLNCAQLSALKLPSTLKRIGKTILNGTNYYKTGSNWSGKVLYYTGNGYKYVLGYNAQRTEDSSTTLTLEATTVLVAASAFEDAGITSISMPETVKYIGDYAFSGASLTSVTLPETSKLSTIGEGAFKKCRKLLSFTVTSEVVSIGEEAFGDCVELVTVTFDSLTICGKITSKTSCGGICSIATTVLVKTSIVYGVGTYISGNAYTKEPSPVEGYTIYKKN